MNGLLMMVVVLVYYIVERYDIPVKRIMKPKYLFFCVALVALLLPAAMQSGILKSVLASLGREATFTGRDLLWRDAILHITQSPIIGKGPNIKFFAATGLAKTQAHNLFLDCAAKYGLVSLFIMLATVFNEIKQISKMDNKNLAICCGLFIFVLMFHSIFDTMPLFPLICILSLSEYCALVKIH